ncbi:hypothetical protein MATL_G00172170 [Megalops atlanticus]|uniref:C2 domain-containing protein n=1 Tax=Megalops atlanticus TaxID=7932 RepID=A0A9D3PU08_MEGAT|nr:hypothetical protein MATL_G00172170 [Megalops atlanticus]
MFIFFRDLKKSTGDWFYDQRVNRFSTMPGHDIVRSSLKKRPPLKKRETVGEVLLQNKVMNPSHPSPVPCLRVKDLVANEKTVLCEPANPPEAREQQRSDTESAEKASLSSLRTDTESSRGTPVLPRRDGEAEGESTAKSSPAGSCVSTLTVPVKAEDTSSHSSNIETVIRMRGIPLPGLVAEDGGLFKRSIKRVPKPSDYNRPISVLDLREGGAEVTGSTMGDRSKSVPGLNMQEEEEEEDIDSLVEIHRKTTGSSTLSLRSSKSTLGSLMSVYSEAGDYDTVEVSGNIAFSLSYDERTQTLSVLVKDCSGLAYGDSAKQRSNPYVKCYLLPDKSRQSKRKTTTKRNTINPVYNETLKYSITHSQLLTRSLQLSVWHHDRLGRNAFLGEVDLPLDSRNLTSTHEEHVALRGKVAASLASAFTQYKGELVISLKYVSANEPSPDKAKGKKKKKEGGGELHVLIKEAKNLTAMKAGGTSDSFVKGYLLPCKTKATKRKTPVVKKTLNPHYDHTFVYKDLTLEQLKGMCLELTVWDREAMSSNDFLGGVRLSSGGGAEQGAATGWTGDSTGEEVGLWQKMMQYPDSWAEGTLPLRSSMSKGK